MSDQAQTRSPNTAKCIRHWPQMIAAGRLHRDGCDFCFDAQKVCAALGSSYTFGSCAVQVLEGELDGGATFRQPV